MDRRITRHSRSLTIALIALAVVGALALSGCITSPAGTPAYTDLSLGRMRVVQPVTSASTAQILTEYGLFYSTDLEAIKAIDADASTGVTPDPSDVNVFPVIESQPDVKVAKRSLSRAVPASTAGTLTIDLRGLEPGTTYYTRYYAIAQFDTNDSADGQLVGTLFAVSSHTTSDPTLSKLVKSKGTLSPKFVKNVYSYKNTISRKTKGSRITVAPSIAGSSVQMKIGATGTYAPALSKYVAVSKGKSKVLYIKVTAPDGITAEYTVTVKRK